ncbi:sodium/potassium-transporting ATPase subunit beta-1-like [Anneissia japonica]|uniref:sodium/potassium-transporting ATPase subunit beta-1-like n=1 Tax=Anneissia japonica TaxID=1529436 RepID=UPI0014257D0C|nr:sodium/potassium-transporting ATPase subunit beta-1-like [Anneissia japonica]
MGNEDERTFLQKASGQWNDFRTFLWNKNEKTVLGRNGKSWAQIGLFYLVFYTCLAVFWAIMLIVFLQTITDDQPKFKSYIGTPGLYQIPKFSEKLNPIKFDVQNEKTYLGYVKELQTVYDEYLERNGNGNYSSCVGNEIRDFDGVREEICEFDIEEQFGDVCKPPHFGYKFGKPCIFVGLNRVWGWKPENYPSDGIPDAIKKTHEENFITVACQVYKDAQTLLNSTMIAPVPGFSFKYYPFLGAINDNYKDMYVSPLVAIQFDLSVKNREVRLVCQSYAANIEPGNGLFDTSYRSELRIDMTITDKS